MKKTDLINIPLHQPFFFLFLLNSSLTIICYVVGGLPPPLLVTVAPTNASCAGCCDGTINLTVSVGTQPYSGASVMNYNYNHGKAWGFSLRCLRDY
ncbi:MAG: SprB repeat-containing protein [Bacteroidota bacterium]